MTFTQRSVLCASLSLLLIAMAGCGDGRSAAKSAKTPDAFVSKTHSQLAKGDAPADNIAKVGRADVQAAAAQNLSAIAARIKSGQSDFEVIDSKSIDDAGVVLIAQTKLDGQATWALYPLYTYHDTTGWAYLPAAGDWKHPDHHFSDSTAEHYAALTTWSESRSKEVQDLKDAGQWPPKTEAEKAAEAKAAAKKVADEERAAAKAKAAADKQAAADVAAAEKKAAAEAKAAAKAQAAADAQAAKDAKAAAEMAAKEPKPAEEAKPVDEAKPAEEVKPAEEAKPVEEAKSVEEAKPVEPKPDSTGQ